jgi:hypothetical protein
MPAIVEQGKKQLSPLVPGSFPVISFTANQRAGVQSMRGKTDIFDIGVKDGNVIGRRISLIVKDHCHKIVRRVRSIGPEITGLVYENAKSANHSLRSSCLSDRAGGGVTPPSSHTTPSSCTLPGALKKKGGGVPPPPMDLGISASPCCDPQHLHKKILPGPANVKEKTEIWPTGFL